MSQSDWFIPAPLKVGHEPKILVFRYVGDRGPSEVMLMPVEVPDTAVTLDQVLGWLPYACDYEHARYLIIDSNYQLNADTNLGSPVTIKHIGEEA